MKLLLKVFPVFSIAIRRNLKVLNDIPYQMQSQVLVIMHMVLIISSLQIIQVTYKSLELTHDIFYH
jgi:hypothetical protein